MRKLILTTAAVAAAIAGAFAAEPSFGTITDSRDGQTYKTVKIGQQNWMAQNLNYLPKIGNHWCYDNRADNCAKYGRLYDWATAMRIETYYNWSEYRNGDVKHQGICPQGWHIPTLWEWDILAKAAGNVQIAGKVKWVGEYGDIRWFGACKVLKAKSGWIDSYVNSTDDLGFSALPGGQREDSRNQDVPFRGIGVYGSWWMATEDYPDEMFKEWDGCLAKHLNINICYDDDDDVYGGAGHKESGLSVRCVQDDGNPSDSVKRKMEEKKRKDTETRRRIEDNSEYFTDSRDNRRYLSIKIGGKKWMAEDLNYATSGGSWCNGYNNKPDSSDCGAYDRLYNWDAAKRACPIGWRLPSRSEWNRLEQAVGGKEIAGKMLKAKVGWGKENGTDDYGFSALPGGSYRNGSFIDAGYDGGNWWTSTGRGLHNAYYRHMDYFIDEYHNKDIMSERYGDKIRNGYSVRCVADSP
jgi:uncharacterized protein (TIGR02145 family)